MILNKNKYMIIDNKLYIFSDSGSIEDLGLKKIGAGTEGCIYKFDGNHLIKVYRKDLIKNHQEIYNEDRINKISSFRKKIKNTNLCYGPLYINGDFSGSIIKYHKFAPNMNIFLIIPSIDYKINRMNELLCNVKELQDNGIFHFDLTAENLLLPYMKHIKIIDCDGKSIEFSNRKNEYYETIVYRNLFILMLNQLFNFTNCEDQSLLENYNDCSIESFLSGFNIDSSLIDDIQKERYCYELLRDFLMYVKNNKILIKK